MKNKSLGAGDQGLMFGYANSDTDTIFTITNLSCSPTSRKY